MDALMIVYMIVSIVFSLFSISYVTADVISEVVRKRKNAPKPEPRPQPQPQPQPQPEIEVIESAPVEIPEDFPEPVSAQEGIEVIDVAWPESMVKNKIYRYDPDGEILQRGDTVMVPTFDKHRNGEILRTATVINGNYRTEDFPANRVLKKIVRVVKN